MKRPLGRGGRRGGKKGRGGEGRRLYVGAVNDSEKTIGWPGRGGSVQLQTRLGLGPDPPDVCSTRIRLGPAHGFQVRPPLPMSPAGPPLASACLSRSVSVTRIPRTHRGAGRIAKSCPSHLLPLIRVAARIGVMRDSAGAGLLPAWLRDQAGCGLKAPMPKP